MSMIQNVISILEEEINPESIDVSSVILKDDLNLNIWQKIAPVDDNDYPAYNLSKDLRIKMIHIGEEFFKYINSSLKRLKLLDIQFTGSMCNYNWTESSDVDIHIIVDYKDISKDDDLVFDYLLDKYSIWKKRNNIKLCGYDVECYAQNITEKPKKHSGVFSLMQNEWLSLPSKEEINIDFEKIQEKVASIMSFIEDNYNDPNDMQKIADKIWKMRKAGLTKDGEFSIENLVFKILRRNGTLEYLKKVTI